MLSSGWCSSRLLTESPPSVPKGPPSLDGGPPLRARGRPVRAKGPPVRAKRAAPPPSAPLPPRQPPKRGNTNANAVYTTLLMLGTPSRGLARGTSPRVRGRRCPSMVKIILFPCLAVGFGPPCPPRVCTQIFSRFCSRPSASQRASGQSSRWANRTRPGEGANALPARRGPLTRSPGRHHGAPFEARSDGAHGWGQVGRGGGRRPGARPPLEHPSRPLPPASVCHFVPATPQAVLVVYFRIDIGMPCARAALHRIRPAELLPLRAGTL